MNTCPAIVSVPERGVDAVFAFSPYVTTPGPFPAPPSVIARKLGEFDVAVQLHPAVVVTVIDPPPAVAGACDEDADSE
jgi:hypothetical protein